MSTSEESHPLLKEEALVGLAGDFVRTIEPHTEADPAALLFQFLVAFGNVVGRGPHLMVESTPHRLNLYLVIVGDTAKSRKGTSWGHVDRFFAAADGGSERSAGKQDLPWHGRLGSGLSSGEGLIYRVRDAAKSASLHESSDSGVEDKRLLVVESEYGVVLRVMKRDGNTLSPVLRSAWDGQSVLQTMTKASPTIATDAHISVVGHITQDELIAQLDRAEALNGFINRFLWVRVKRARLLPFGGEVDDSRLSPLVQRLTRGLRFARKQGRISLSADARKLWEKEYLRLSKAQPGLLGTAIARSEAQVLRIAAIYALLDRVAEIEVRHLRAALALWAYAEQSAESLFATVALDPVSRKILSAISDAPKGLTGTELRDLFGRNLDRGRMTRALEELRERGLVRCRRERTSGRPTTRWLPSTRRTTETTETTRGPLAARPARVSEGGEP